MPDEDPFKLPGWAAVPLVIVEVTVLLLLFSWLYITRPVDTYQVPEIIGRPLDETRSRLDSTGIDYSVKYRSSLKTPENVIIGQSPSPGSEIRAHRKLTLVVSRGGEKVRVPDLSGLTLMGAENELTTSESEDDYSGPLLSIGNVVRIYSEAAAAGQIIDQEPEPGSRIFQGSRVHLLLSRGPWPRTTRVPDLTGVELSRARSRLGSAGLEAGNISYVLRPQSPPSVVLEQSPEPGLVVRPGQKLALTVNLSDTRPRRNKRRHTIVRFTPPKSLLEGRLKVILVDREGERVVFDGRTRPGRTVETVASFMGKARLKFYWNGELYRIRKLESQR